MIIDFLNSMFIEQCSSSKANRFALGSRERKTAKDFIHQTLRLDMCACGKNNNNERETIEATSDLTLNFNINIYVYERERERV